MCCASKRFFEMIFVREKEDNFVQVRDPLALASNVKLRNLVMPFVLVEVQKI